MILTFSRREKVRLATIWLTACSVAIAIVAYVSITFMIRAGDQRRVDQIKLETLQTELCKLQGILDAGILGSGTSRFDISRDNVERGLADMEESGHREDVFEIRRAYASYLRFADEELQAIYAGNKSLSLRLNMDSTRPAYTRLAAATGRLSDQLSRDAAQWSTFAMLMTGWSLLVAAGLLTGVLGLYQKKVISLFALESGQQAVRSSERRFRSLVQNSNDVIAVASPDGILRLVSDASRRTMGRVPEQLVGRALAEEVHPEDQERLIQLFGEVASGGRDSAQAEARLREGNAGYRHQQVHMTNLQADADVAGILLTIHDLTDRKALEQELTHHAFHDRLTGLPNRALFMDRLAHRLRASARSHEPVAIMFIDLDNFKVVNDSLGHEAGDSLLIKVAERLQTVLRPSDTVARLGGDEFTIMLDGAKTEEHSALLAERILGAFEAPVKVAEREVFVTASIGIAIADQPNADVQGLLRDADTAMYRAKGHGKSKYVVFDRTMNEHAVERLEIESDLRTAIELGQFALNYQPIVDIETSELREVEVLLRWAHPTRGLISPITFIPIAEETGLICPIGTWVLREACRQLSIWRRGFRHYRDLGLSVNVSARQFYQFDFVRQVADILDEFQLEPSRIKLEITESAMLSDLDRIRGILEELRGLGVRIAIDDFGTGYSSMAYLSHLPVDTLKIDRSFVSTLGGNYRIDGVVRAMIAMARTLGLDVTSEGIETSQQLLALQELGCDSGQGYLFARPVDALGISALLAAPRKEPLYRAAA